MICDHLTNLAECDCVCKRHRIQKRGKLTILLLDCWQREYDVRPYKHFQLKQTFFEERMRRSITEEDWQTVFEFLKLRLPASVKICNLNIPELDFDTYKYFVNGLMNAESIQLKNVSLSKDMLTALKEEIRSMKVKHLDVSQNELSTELAFELRCILLNSEILESLNVANCFLNENSFPILADGIHKSKTVHSIDLSRPCPMSSVSIFDTEKFIIVVAQLLWQNKLTNLVLRQCELNGHDMEILSEYLGDPNTKLLHLDLQSNNVGSEGTEIILSALAKTGVLQTLNLSTNNLGSRGGIVIARFIAYTNLRTLDISYNQIGSEAMYELLTAIKNRELKVIRIFGNKFDPNTATVVKRLLRAKVFEEHNIDVTYTWDHSKDELCVIPNMKTGRLYI